MNDKSTTDAATKAGNAKIRLLVIDDHTLFRRGLTALLARDVQLQIIGDAADAGEGQRKARELQPDVILLDNHLPGVNGVDALPALREAAPNAHVLMLTVSEDEADLAAALRARVRQLRPQVSEFIRVRLKKCHYSKVNCSGNRGFSRFKAAKICVCSVLVVDSPALGCEPFRVMR